MRSSINLNRGVLASICCFALLAFLSLLPAFFKTSAGNNRSHDSESKAARFGDYDIRTDKAASEKVAEFRGHASKNAVDVANLRGSFAHGEKKLRGKISSLKVEYNDDLRIPEVIGPDVRGGKEFLNAPTTEKRSEVLKRFLTDNDQLTGVSVEHVAKLKLASDYKNPEDDLAMAEYEQELNGIPVFRGSVKAGFTKRNQIVRPLVGLRLQRLHGAQAVVVARLGRNDVAYGFRVDRQRRFGDGRDHLVGQQRVRGIGQHADEVDVLRVGGRRVEFQPKPALTRVGRGVVAGRLIGRKRDAGAHNLRDL